MALDINTLEHIITESLNNALRRLSEEKLYHCSPEYKTVEDFTRDGLWLTFDDPDTTYGNSIYEYEVDVENLNLADEYIVKDYIDKYGNVDENSMYWDEENEEPYYTDLMTEPWGETWLAYLKEDGYDGYYFEYCDGARYLYLFNPKDAKLI